MITLQDLSVELDHLFSKDAFQDFCPNGLQVEGNFKIKRVGFAVSASLAVIEEAVKRGVDALIVHHGLFWNKDSYQVIGPKRKKLAHLLLNEISLFAYHLPLDAHQEIGNNWKAADDLGLINCTSFSSVGVKGELSALSVHEFKQRLEKYYAHPAHCALGGKDIISSVAIVSGGAHRQIEQAVEAGVDCFVTGSFDEPIWDIAHEQKIHFFALGHYATERVGVFHLMHWIQNRFGIETEWIDFPNPF